MADRFFPNSMPDFVDLTEAAAGACNPSLLNLLRLPYPSAAHNFLRAAIDVKDKVVRETLARFEQCANNPTLYTGALGTAFLLLKSYQVTSNRRDLDLCSEIIKSCDSSSQGLPYVTFICGRAGVCALGAAVAKVAGDEGLLNHYLKSFDEVPLMSLKIIVIYLRSGYHEHMQYLLNLYLKDEIKIPDGVPNEILYGRSGYLWACLFLNAHIGKETISSDRMSKVARDILRDGKSLSKKSGCPLMFEWHGEKYWGAAHGLTGIMHVLMDIQLKPEEQEFVKGTLQYMIQNCFPGGNYPLCEDSEDDRLVHWCHGATGAALTLTKASQVFNDKKFLDSAAEAAEVVWNRGLLRRVGICHGVSGNAYAFLSLYRRTGNREYLYRAKAFACFLLNESKRLIANGKMHGGDYPYSLFEGQAGMAYLFFDMVNPSEARFPGYEL